ncbi:polyphosphoinositide phosphatase-like [Saccoglossus kowalevskii]
MLLFFFLYQRFYLVGSNNTETRFFVLKIDRTEPKDLVIHDDRMEYTQHEIKDLLNMINEGNKPKLVQRGMSGLSRTVSAFGIVGFVRFLEGYYIILITKRRRIAVIGGHNIYKIEDTSMIYIPNDSVRQANSDESRYVKIFQNLDISSNFYFSYSYDLTHSLQYNFCEPKDIGNLNLSGKEKVGLHNPASYKFVWNSHMLKGFENVVQPDWVLYIIHGFMGQSNICIYGKSVYLTLIARRSNQFAGTRFLKRGANSEGQVANEVETEQIVYDASVMSPTRGRYTSYLQLRGSIPGMWSQDISTMVPKPPIMLDIADPFAYIAGQHFNEVTIRYGAPIIILNLVKKKEKRRHECILSEEIEAAVEYLNQFLPPQFAIRYIAWDMARFTKNKNVNVMARLAEMSLDIIKQTGFFHSGPGVRCTALKGERCSATNCTGDQPVIPICRQTGVVRTNCVDCLDRTNTAQFAVGKCVLGYQLYALGVIDKPDVDFDSDAIRMLEDLYEDHGDTLALQYGGSQLVHSISTYRKISPWTAHSRDIMQTLSRYYSNAFSDTEKQSCLNLFLGVFEPCEDKPPIWDLSTDYYLHHNDTMSLMPRKRPCYTEWFDLTTLKALPFPYDEESKTINGGDVIIGYLGDERVDPYIEYYKPHELTVYSDLFYYSMSHSIRDFMPKFVVNYSPFAVRVQPGRRKESRKGNQKASAERKNAAGSPSATSSDSNSSSSDDGSSSDEDGLSFSASPMSPSPRGGDRSLTLNDYFPTMAQSYGVEISKYKRHDIQAYQRFVSVEMNAKHSVITEVLLSPDLAPIKKCMKRTTRLVPTSVFSLDSSNYVDPPTVDRASKRLYESYVSKGKQVPATCEGDDYDIYRKYVIQKYDRN